MSEWTAGLSTLVGITLAVWCYWGVVRFSPFPLGLKRHLTLAALCVLIVAFWPGFVLLRALYRTETGRAMIERFIFVESGVR